MTNTAMPVLESALVRRQVSLADYEVRLLPLLVGGWRLGLLTARRLPEPGAFALMTVVLNPANGACELWETPLPSGAHSFPSITPRIPQAHWFERAIHDFFGLRPEGHPRFKSLILHEAWPAGFHPLRELATTSSSNEPGDNPILSPSFSKEGLGEVTPRIAEPTINTDNVPLTPPPYEGGGWGEVSSSARSYQFLHVAGEGVYEIPVGPIHAGIIEPGHFRFSCLGEIIQNLEIRLGYQHRGIEQRLTEIPWRHARYLAEAASSDTSAGNALAHALAIEQVLNVSPAPMAIWLRAIALEIERVACHLGDLGGLCGDIGFTGMAASFSRLRGIALGMAERLSGSRYLTAYVIPGGVAHPPDPLCRDDLGRAIKDLTAKFRRAAPLLMDNPGAQERMIGTGRVKHSLAADFGLVGPAGRASGIDYDVRAAFHQEPYQSTDWKIAPVAGTGDVLARAEIKVREVQASLAFIRSALWQVPDHGEHCTALPPSLPPNAAGIGIVEAWRGELIHLILTDEKGRISRYAIKDPSFNNWTGLAIAVRGQLVADFPLCNKSFGLSYSGNDL
jgi:Ni,Fe-hydrogenase III large subunit/Ni,Fe-hydrogenase III component G